MIDRDAIRKRIEGLLVGTAVGDSLGLPFEGLSRKRIARLSGPNLRQRFVFGHGMVSDDTDHAIMTAQALLSNPDSPAAFQSGLARNLRWWLLRLPCGMGSATLRGTIRLWLGFGPNRSGVVSAGNGPAMRSAILGIFFADRIHLLDEMVLASTRITHTDPRTQTGSLAVAHSAAWMARQPILSKPSVDEFLAILQSVPAQDGEWPTILDCMKSAARANLSVPDFADSLGLSRGVSGYIYHTIPVALYAWHRHFGSFEDSLSSVIRCGGDTDTTGAIVGALAGLSCGVEAIPSRWKDPLLNWPHGRQFIRRLTDALAQTMMDREPHAPPPSFWPGLIARNLLFQFAVFVHIIRRCLPPY
jgi:ADP-ribosyl-[dinitrogen reductase] hydrolase